MVRPNRIKQYKFSAGSLIADAAGQFSVYSNYPVNGTLCGVHIGESTYAAAGSLFLAASGPELVAWSMVSGTTRQIGVNASGVTYPRATLVDTNANYLSGGVGYSGFTEIPLNSVLHLTGSGLGNATSGAEVNVIYI